MEQPIGWSMFR